jgi:predicted  nucleic acid-binding Zn-ribbon protein
MNEDVIENIRGRMERCRRLASMITDKKAIEVLEQMAREAEADIASLEERSGEIKQGPKQEV